MGKYMKKARKKLPPPPFKPYNYNASSNPRKPLPFRRSTSVASAAGNPNQRHQKLESGDGNMRELTHGCATRASSKHNRVLILEYSSFPSASELDQFFAAAEKLLQKQFIERYNYDPLNDCPVPGRYEWTRLA